MINLLPVFEKARLQKEYRIRVATVTLGLLIVSLLIGSFLLLPALFISNIRATQIEEQISIIEQTKDKTQQAETEAAFRDTREKLKVLTPPKNHSVIADTFTAITKARTDGIQIHGLLLQNQNISTSLVTIQGSAETREDLLLFSRALETLDLFEEVTLPVSNLAKDRDITFTLTLRGS